jgi:RNA polymerase sigma factor (sigma-70 family)
MVIPTTRAEAEATFLSQLPLIDRIVASIARRHALRGDDADEFTSWVRAKMIEGDYAIIRKFGGRSSLATFLTVVIANLFRDYRTQCWGRWRPSMVAKRMGELAVRLEALIYRDGNPVAQAIAMLRAKGAIDLTDRELAKIAAELPARRRRAGASADAEGTAVDELEASEPADAALWESEQMKAWEAAQGVMERGLSTLHPLDQLILRLRYWEGFTVAEIARALSLDQKPLYRRLDASLEQLRRAVESEGLDGDAIAGLF